MSVYLIKLYGIDDYTSYLTQSTCLDKILPPSGTL